MANIHFKVTKNFKLYQNYFYTRWTNVSFLKIVQQTFNCKCNSERPFSDADAPRPIYLTKTFFPVGPTKENIKITGLNNSSGGYKRYKRNQIKAVQISLLGFYMCFRTFPHHMDIFLLSRSFFTASLRNSLIIIKNKQLHA